jgi:hypothetical protein
MAKQCAGPRLIPALPNEISDIILLQLSFHDLVNGFFVSHAWQDYLDGDGELCKRMFRLPKQLRSDSAAQEKFVDDLWLDTYAKVKDEEPKSAIWNHVDFNPFYDDPNGSIDSEYSGDDESPDDEGGYLADWTIPFRIRGLPTVPNHLKADLKDLWLSMFVTYPPVTRIEYSHADGGIMCRWRSDMLVRAKGFTIGYLRNCVWGSEQFGNRYGLRFWPERMYEDSIAHAGRMYKREEA